MSDDANIVAIGRAENGTKLWKVESVFHQVTSDHQIVILAVLIEGGSVDGDDPFAGK